jgi:hypothetical protein
MAETPQNGDDRETGESEPVEAGPPQEPEVPTYGTTNVLFMRGDRPADLGVRLNGGAVGRRTVAIPPQRCAPHRPGSSVEVGRRRSLRLTKLATSHAGGSVPAAVRGDH